MSTSCPFCAESALEYDAQALVVLCRQCGYVTDNAELEVIGRGTEDGSHLAGRSLYDGPVALALKPEHRSLDSIKSKEERTRLNLVCPLLCQGHE